jgi:hypothetical protein
VTSVSDATPRLPARSEAKAEVLPAVLNAAVHDTRFTQALERRGDVVAEPGAELFRSPPCEVEWRR